MSERDNDLRGLPSYLAKRVLLNISNSSFRCRLPLFSGILGGGHYHILK